VRSLVPRPSTPPVFDRLQYAKTEGEGRGGSTGSRTGCNLRIWRMAPWHGRCCMIAFLSCLNFALPILRLCLSLPTLVRQGYSALLVSILSGESKELITVMKAQGYSGEKATGTISIRLV